MCGVFFENVLQFMKEFLKFKLSLMTYATTGMVCQLLQRLSNLTGQINNSITQLSATSVHSYNTILDNGSE